MKEEENSEEGLNFSRQVTETVGHIYYSLDYQKSNYHLNDKKRVFTLSKTLEEK